MKTKFESIPNGQGPVSDLKEPEVPELSVDFIEKALSRDLTVCMSLLQAILSDKELRLHVATFMQGRYNNAKHKPDPAQINLDI